MNEVGRSSTVERVFSLLDEWRHLPAYQLERRADVFFALFLPEVLGRQFRTDIDQRLIPEFPLKNPSDNQSSKVDFLALSQDRKQAFLVELKTDMASKNQKQKDVLYRASEKGLRTLVEDILTLARKTKEKAKYGHLLWHLRQLGLVGGVDERITELQGRRFSNALKHVDCLVSEVEVRVVYVQPRKDEEVVIDFATFAEKVVEGADSGKGESEVRRMFAHYIQTWATTDAGSAKLGSWPTG